MVLVYILCVSIIINVSLTDDNDLFSSTADLTRLLQLETQFVSDLHTLVDKLQQDLDIVKKFLADFYDNRELNNEWRYVSNPINSLYLIKRLGVNFARYNVSQVLANNETEAIKSKWLNISSTSFPKQSDWIGASSGIYLLQEHYNLNISELSEGVIHHEDVQLHSDHVLEGEELYQIGVRAIDEGHYDTGVQWLELAYSKLKGVPEETLFGDIKDLKNSLKVAKVVHDHYLDKAGPVGFKHRCNRIPFDEKLRKKKKYKAAIKENSSKRAEREKSIIPLFTEFRNDTLEKFKHYHESQLRDNFEDLCVGVEHRNASHDVDQSCHHLHHNDPFSRLGPFKLEQLQDQPYITLIHELMSEQETEHFKDYAKDKLERSGHGDNGDGGVTSFKRTSKQTWMEFRSFGLNMSETMEVMGVDTQEEAEVKLSEDNSWNAFFMTKDRLNITDKVSGKVSNRMERATSFRLWNPFSAEKFQVANYGLGGQYTVHMDPHGYWEGRSRGHPVHSVTGDRIATIMVYLESVEAGGATAFPSVGIRVPVTKGTAAFWINMRTSGLLDRLTHHGGCPVLVGSKWITNKWVGYLEQWRNFKCSRDGGVWGRFKPFTKYY